MLGLELLAGCLKAFSVLDALVSHAGSPSTEAAGLEGPAHEADDILFCIATYFQNLFERDAIGPGSPDDPILGTDGRYGFYGLRGGPCVGFGHHVLLKNV